MKKKYYRPSSIFNKIKFSMIINNKRIIIKYKNLKIIDKVILQN